MSSRRLRTTILLTTVATSAALSGCGFFLTQGPPADHADLTSFTCTESNVKPAFDLIFGGIMVLGAVASTRRDPSPEERDDLWLFRKDGITATYGVAAGTAGISAYVGFDKTARCRDARRDLAEGLRVAR